MATFDLMGSFDLDAVQKEVTNVADTLSDLHDSFKSSVSDVFGAIDESLPPVLRHLGDALDDNQYHPFDVQERLRMQDGPTMALSVDQARLLNPDRLHATFVSDRPIPGRNDFTIYGSPENISRNIDVVPSMLSVARRMLDGIDLQDGLSTLGLKEIADFKINADFFEQNIRQHAGYAAEVISTAMENLQALKDGTGITTYRADDRPDLDFKRNDQYVDKIRVNESGDVIERIQTKFIGKDGADWVSKMVQKKFDKYFDGNHVDKIECPKDYHQDAVKEIQRRLEKLQNQLDRTLSDGKTDVAEILQQRIDKLQKLDDMLEPSLVSMDDAIFSVLHPSRYTAKFATEIIPSSYMKSIDEGIHSGAFTAGLTLVSSTVLHGREFFAGEISAPEFASKVALETGASGLIDGASDFVSTAVGTAMRGSSHELIQSVGGSVLPAVAVSFAVESYDSISDYAQGLIDGNELAFELGENAATIGGGALAGAKAGAIMGTFAGPVGSVVGGIAGGLVGSMVASEAYLTAVEVTPGACQEIAEGIEGFTSSTMEAIGREFPDSVDSARASFNDFFESNNIPVRA